MRWWPVLLMVALYVVRVDLWWWRDPRLVGGLPIGLLYHLLFCVAVSISFWLVVRHCWPAELDELEAGADEVVGGRQ